jgi:hypothetical protein
MFAFEVVVRVDERLHERQIPRRRRPSAGLDRQPCGLLDLTSNHVLTG